MSEEQKPNKIYDLLYCGEHREEIEAIVRESFPEAEVKDASDEIHRGRFSVQMEYEDDDWMLWVMRKGLHDLSFHWNIMKMQNPERLKPLLMQVIEEQRAEKDNNS